MSRPITAEEFAAALDAAGMTDSLMTERFIIDARPGCAVVLHTVAHADERLLTALACLTDEPRLQPARDPGRRQLSEGCVKGRHEDCPISEVWDCDCPAHTVPGAPCAGAHVNQGHTASFTTYCQAPGCGRDHTEESARRLNER